MKPKIFDHSMLSLFRTCPKKFYWRMVRDLVSIDEENYVTAFGGALHEALAVWYKRDPEAPIEESKKAAIDEFLKFWEPYEGKDPSGKRCSARGVSILYGYWKEYEVEPFTVINRDWIEIGFALDLDGFIITGKMDGIVHWEVIFPGLIVLEHKFSNSEGFLVTEPNHQIDTYIWGASRTLELPVIGAYFNQVYHTAKDITKNKYKRELTRRSPEMLSVWEESTLAWIKAIHQAFEDEFWPLNTNNCGAYFRQCEYARLCLKECSPSEQTEMIEVLFKQDKWEPFHDARKHKADE